MKQTEAILDELYGAIRPGTEPASERRWAVLSDEEAAEIAEFGGIDVEKVRGIEMLVLLKAGHATLAH